MGLPALPDRIEFTETGLIVPDNLSFDEWLACGETLKRIDRAIQWWVGDWLNAGEQNYGEKYAQALDETEASYSTLSDYKWVASRIPFSLRRENLSFTIHKEIANIKNEKERVKLLTQASEETALYKETNGNHGKKWTVREAKSKVRQLSFSGGDAEPLPPDKYRIIYADPPWKYGDTRDGVSGYSSAADHYPVMTIRELCGLPVVDLALNDAVLFLWTTSPLLEECFQVINAWGFDYKTSYVWDKVGHNVGHYNSVRHELLLICIKGSCLPDISTLHDSVIVIEKTRTHSEKPEYFRKLIDTMYTTGNRIELFRRGKAPDNWDVWGNEAIAI